MQIAQWNPKRMIWETDQIDLFSEQSEPYSETWPTSGHMKPDGSLWPLPKLVRRTAGNESSSSPCLPTPQARDARGVFPKNNPDDLGGVVTNLNC